MSTLLLDPPLLCQQLGLDLREVLDVGQQTELVPGHRGLRLLVVQVHQGHHTDQQAKVIFKYPLERLAPVLSLWLTSLCFDNCVVSLL